MSALDSFSDRLHQLIQSKKIHEAIDLFAGLEEKLLEQRLLGCHGGESSYFYSKYLITLLLNDDLNEARFLWKRAPAAAKTANNQCFAELWSVGKALWQSDIPAASIILNQLSTPVELKSLIEILHHHIIKRFITVTSRTTTEIYATSLAEQLQVSEEELKQCAMELGFMCNHPTDANLLQHTDNGHDHSSLESQLRVAQKGLTQLKELTKVTAHFEKTPPCVDLSGNKSESLVAEKSIGVAAVESLAAAAAAEHKI